MEEDQLFRLALLTSLLGICSLFITSTILIAPLEGPYKVTNVVDGDTLDLETVGRIRLAGINAPESGECGYDNATIILEEFVLGKEVYLGRDLEKVGKYGRILGYIYLEELFINAYLVEEGFVKVYDKYNLTTSKYSELKSLEDGPKEGGKGVWGCANLREDCLYVASKNSNIYHKPECKWAKKIKPENLICFHSEEELEGYEPAKSC